MTLQLADPGRLAYPGACTNSQFQPWYSVQCSSCLREARTLEFATRSRVMLGGTKGADP